MAAEQAQCPVRSQPLLKFLKGGEPTLDPAGLGLVRSVRGQICPFVFLGDGRAGKSYLASALLGQEGAFVSSDSSQSVTEGIDVAVGSANGSGEQLLVLDCEGGNNALAKIHSLVNVIAVVACTHVVFVANNMASEAAVKDLASAVAARTVMHAAEGSGFKPPQRLTFVVNKTTLRYGDDALEKLLSGNLTGEGVAGRDEMRQDIKAAFPERRFVSVMHSVLPGFAQTMATFKTDLYAARQPMVVSGMPVCGEQFCHILELIIKEVQQMNRVSAPSMTRAVIFDGFLRPLVDRLLAKAKGKLPALNDYDPDIARYDARPDLLIGFGEATAHLAPGPVLDEARQLLVRGLDEMWEALLRENDLLGEATAQLSQETRHIVEKEESRCLGGKSLLRGLMVTQQTVRVESRAVVRKKRGGDPVCSDWERGDRILRLREAELEEELPKLPRMQGRVARRVPSLFGHLLGRHSYEPCLFVVRDLHLMWWTLPCQSDEPTQCVNLLECRCSVDTAGEDAAEASFMLTLEDCLDEGGGQEEALWFQMREPASWTATFACCAGHGRQAGTTCRSEALSNVADRDKWVSCIEAHITLAARVAMKLAWPLELDPPMLQDVLDAVPLEPQASAGAPDVP